MRKGFKFSLVETRIGLLYGVKQELSCGDHAGPHVCVCVCLCVCVWGEGPGYELKRQMFGRVGGE